MSEPDHDEPEGPEEQRPEDAPIGVADGSMRASILSVLFCGLIFGVVGFAVSGWRTGLGVTLGGLIAAANLWVFARVGQAFVSRQGNTAPWAVIALLKMTLLFGGVWLILRSGSVSALSLIAGYAALPVGITVGSLFGPKPGGGPEGRASSGGRRGSQDEKETPSARRDGDVIKGARAGRKDPP
jgi:hypothetical protein